MESKIKDIEYKIAKLQWDMFKDKEIANLIFHIFNSTEVIYGRKEICNYRNV